MPTAANRRRDKAQRKLTDFYLGVIAKRRADKSGRPSEAWKDFDLIEALLDSTYKDGQRLPDRHVAHLMIALLTAGSFNASVALSWCLLCLGDRPDLVAELRQEQEEVHGRDGEGSLRELSHDGLARTPLMTAFIKEVMRLHPAIHTILRKVRPTSVLLPPATDQLLSQVTSPIAVPLSVAAPKGKKTYVIPAGDLLVTTPLLSHVDPWLWPDASTFDPHRWLEGHRKPSNGAYAPFGAGANSCVGQPFAMVLLASAIGTVIRECDVKLDGRLPDHDYSVSRAVVKASLPAS